MLNDIAIKAALRKAKADGKPQKRYDEKGLYLLVKPNGAALWRFKYLFGVKKATTGKRKGQLVGIEKGIGLGTYKDVPLKRAREKRDDARKLVADGYRMQSSCNLRTRKEACDPYTTAQSCSRSAEK